MNECGEQEIQLNILMDPQEVQEVQADTSVKKTWYFRKHIWKIVVCAVLVLLVVALAFTGTETLLKFINTNDDSDMAKTQKAAVCATREYQIKLADLDHWGHREQRITDWAIKISEFSSYLSISASDIHEYTRTQFDVNASPCGNDYEYRVRNFHSGADYATTIDIKSNADDQRSTQDLPFWPSTDTYTNYKTAQKSEEDVHKCYSKYSRETRVFFPDSQEFTTCADLARVFPWSIDISNDKLWTEVKQEPKEYWWMGEWAGYMDDTFYEMEFTLQYGTTELASNGETRPIYGEWSIRIYTQSDGLSSDWNQDVVTDTESLWHSLIDYFGNDDNKDC